MLSRLIAVALMTAVGVAAAPGWAQTNPGAAAPMKKFRVLLPFRVGITFFPLSVADELGYMKAEGIDLDLQVANGSSAVVQQLAAGNAQMGVILAPNTLLGFAEGVKYKAFYDRSEEHTSELQSRVDLVCRLLLEKKKKRRGRRSRARFRDRES